MPGTPPISRLYEKDPSLYEAITARDFEAQARAVLRWVKRGAPRLLELFAGPARHALALQALDARVTCVDASAAMRRHARAAGVRDYVRAKLPSLPVRGLYDGALLLQFSAGILDCDGLSRLLGAVARRLRPGAPLVVELRRLSALRACDAHVLPRTLPWNGRQVRLLCPEDGIEWSEDDWTVAMTMRVDLLDGDSAVETRRWRFSERLVRPADLDRLSKGAFRLESPSAPEFPDSRIVLLRRR